MSGVLHAPADDAIKFFFPWWFQFSYPLRPIPVSSIALFCMKIWKWTSDLTMFSMCCEKEFIITNIWIEMVLFLPWHCLSLYYLPTPSVLTIIFFINNSSKPLYQWNKILCIPLAPKLRPPFCFIFFISMVSVWAHFLTLFTFKMVIIEVEPSSPVRVSCVNYKVFLNWLLKMMHPAVPLTWYRNTPSCLCSKMIALMSMLKN